MAIFADPYATINVVRSLACVSVVISSLEFLVRPRQFRDDGLLNWSVAQLRAAILVKKPVGALLTPLFAYPNILGIVVIRFLSALLLLLFMIHPTRSAFSAILVGLVALSSFALTLRTPFGNDGADQMSLLTFSALTLVYAHPSQLVLRTGLWFLALQVCLSYLTAGVAKLTDANWRNGSYLYGIFGTRTYGNESLVARLSEHPLLARWGASAIISFECLFPLALIAPPPVAFVFLGAGILFHASTAILMGLNTFFWSFIATYPAVLFCCYAAGMLYRAG